MVIRGRQPVIVDTGAPVHRAQWLEKVFSVVEPEDVRWIFLSHDDGDTPAGCSTRSSGARTPRS
jgi:flavorubredoxin